jgi:hypothetical protein
MISDDTLLQILTIAEDLCYYHEKLMLQFAKEQKPADYIGFYRFLPLVAPFTKPNDKEVE